VLLSFSSETNFLTKKIIIKENKPIAKKAYPRITGNQPSITKPPFIWNFSVIR
jgi:hypothetical protein